MRILLNIIKRENFVFFDPINKIHLNRVNPFGDVNVLSNQLKRAIAAGNVIDVDNEFEIEVSEKVKNINDALLKALKVQPKVKEIVVETVEIKAEILEEPKVEEVLQEEVKEDKKKKSKGKVVK